MANLISDMSFIHYGHEQNHFKKELFNPVKNSIDRDGRLDFGKPAWGGLWSTVYTPGKRDEWSRFVRKELPDMKNALKWSFKFKVSPQSLIAVIDSWEDAKDLPGRFRFDQSKFDNTLSAINSNIMLNYYREYFLDFEEMARQGWDGVFVRMSPQLHYVFYGWDVTTLLVFNPDIVQEID